VRIAFKSLLILGEQKRRVAGGQESTTVYDLGSVRDHVLEVSRRYLWLHPRHLLVITFIAAPFLGLLLYVATAFTDGKVWSSPLLVFVLIAGPLVLCYPVSLQAVTGWLMKAQARRERLLAENVPIEAVREEDWEKFRSRLTDSGPLGQLLALSERIKRAKSILEQPQAALPNDEALLKWQEEHGNDPAGRAEATDQVTPARPDIQGKPDSSSG